jgi:uncharacterized membrane protein YeaQ/YmgE (transglycosylase-associated protein family)
LGLSAEKDQAAITGLELGANNSEGSDRRGSKGGKIMEFGSLVAMLIIGALAGWLSGKIMKGRGFGLLGNIIVGIVGAFVAGLIFPALGFSVGGGVIASIFHATIGAVILLFLIGLVKRA